MDNTALLYRLESLTVFRSLLDTPVLSAALELLRAVRGQTPEPVLAAWGRLCALLQNAGAEKLGDWLWAELRFTETPWGRLIEEYRWETPWDIAARRDVETLSALCALDGRALLAPLGLPEEVLEDLPYWSGTPLPPFEALVREYRDHGCGPFARCRAFLWEGGELLPVERPDVPDQSELLGYRRQRSQVEENTRALLAGKLVNNVLLFGDSGTGKSATVKSLLGLPGTEDLRLIEIEKDGVCRMPQLIRFLAGRRQKFILFIDDLAFDEDDMSYSVLKTILEGGLEPRPSNVAIYATSNRRNLVRQTFSSRAGDEVDREETIQEKTALADRFGLRIPYLGLAKGEYLELVDHLARRAGLDIPREELHAQAVRWDARHPGRSPRTAQQFIASLG